MFLYKKKGGGTYLLIIFMCMCIHVHLHELCALHTCRGCRSPGTGVTGGGEAACGCWGLTQGPRQEQ